MTARLLVLALAATLASQGAVQIQLFTGDAAGTGFFDPTPAAPVGGNPGTTLGQQRGFAYSHAANLWGSTLTSTVPIRVYAVNSPLACDATSGTLGAATPTWNLANLPAVPGFPGITQNTWYPIALAEKRTGLSLATNPALASFPFAIYSVFNTELGKPGCLEGSGWYYGVDGNAPAGQIDFVTVLLHELGHGVGFTVGPTNGNTGAHTSAMPSIWESSMRDITLGKSWIEMSDAERAASARNHLNLVWTGPQTTADSPVVLGPGHELNFTDPEYAAASYQVEPAALGGILPAGGLSGVLTRVNDGTGIFTDACEPIPEKGRAALRNRIAFVDRGGCTFAVKALNVQNAGALAMVLINATQADGLVAVGGTAPSVTIPIVSIALPDAEAMLALPQFRANSRNGLQVTLRRSETFRAGANRGYVRLYTPSTFSAGSSVSHWDTSLTPNALMEPFINSNLLHSLVPPADLTFSLLKDIGW